MRRKGGGGRTWIAAAALLLAAALHPAWATAQPSPGAPVLDPSQTARENLQRIAAAKVGVEITLHGGKSYKGRIGGVGDHAVVVTEIEGREFYDAWVALDEVVAIEVRARGGR